MSSVSQNEGRQSPPPERQTGAQMHDPPASGKGTDKFDNKEQANQDQLKVSSLRTPAYSNLTSNPPGPMDAWLGDKFAKGYVKE
ncbi:hypothetical protein ONZ43_g2602 [Nemania bipapillata]|uniref:Uncharacterized protein n=1 Tax=Nemania bipapillata TaxID=110536 RepID=A0ACC2J0C8_9PEZI|nr:hypothetical protein ONZ43_g2602 [Nemania bipapillata]